MMTHLEKELSKLKQSILEMMDLAKFQLKKSEEAFINSDFKLAKEITRNEKRMNAMELSIDLDCENILALFQPVATDLRFVISMLKINSDLERIGDYADGIADYVLEMDEAISSDAINATEVGKMFHITLSMLTDISTALNDEDTSLARKVYKKDAELNSLNSMASQTIRKFIKKDPDATRSLLFLFSVIRKLERVGDHIKNIAENAVFYIEAEIMKHKKLQKDPNKKEK
ncbi:MAG TPA: phosphate signaling complex protein PhoU [Cyclobacteriaceae bacterium]|jgi:phosphate transport system protein